MTTGKVKSIEKTPKVPESSAPSRAFARQPDVGLSAAGFDATSIPQMAGNLAVQQLFRAGSVRAKLAISQPSDPDEEEADRVAEQVVSSAPIGTIQRKCAACEAGGATCPKCEEEEKVRRKEMPGHVPQAGPAVHSQIAGLRGGGQPLPPSIRAFFEPRFGRDFSRVRLHTDGQGQEAARAIQARAFTLGQDVVFGPGENAPESQEGQKLLAHELTHVVQQSRGDFVPGAVGRASRVALDLAGQPRTVQSEAAIPPTVHRSIVPGFLRSDKGTREELEAAIKSEDPSDIKAIDDFSQAEPSQKARLVQILLNKTDLWLFDKRAMARIWNSFGDLETLNDDQVSLLRTCVDRGFNPTVLKGYPFIAGAFRDSVKGQVSENLMQNVALIQQEADSLGLAGEQPKEGEKYDERILKLQELATLIKDAKHVLSRARKIVVAHTGALENLRTGKNEGLLGGKPITFDPENEPQAPTATPVTEVNRALGEMPWHVVYPAYATFSETIASILAQNPALYALQILGEPLQRPVAKPGDSRIRQEVPPQDAPLVYGEQSRLSGFEMMGPKQAREKVGKALLDVYNNARKTLGNVISEKMSPLQFDLVVDQHRKGLHGPRWGKPYSKFVAERVVADDKPGFDEAMEMIGIVLLLGAVAIGTGGAATPILGAILAGADLATAAAAAAYKTFEAQNVQQAAHSAASADTAVTSQQKADRTALDAQMYQFMAIASIAGEVFGALMPAARAAANLEALDILPTAERATAVAEALESMEVGQVALRTGKQPEDLAQIVASRGVADPKAKSALDKIREFISRLAPGAKQLERVRFQRTVRGRTLKYTESGHLVVCSSPCDFLFHRYEDVLNAVSRTRLADIDTRLQTALSAGNVAEAEQIFEEALQIEAELHGRFANLLGTTEGMRIAGGPEAHLLGEHGPEVKNKHLIDRVNLIKNEATLTGFNSASRFTDGRKMELAIADTLAQNRAQINTWLAGPPVPPAGANMPPLRFNPGLGDLGIAYEWDATLGRAVQVTAPLENCLVIVKADGRGGFIVQTAYPVR